MALAIIHVTRWLGVAVEFNVDSSRPLNDVQGGDNVAVGVHNNAGAGTMLLGEDLDLGFSIALRERLIAPHFYVNDGRNDFSGHLLNRRLQTQQHVYVCALWRRRALGTRNEDEGPQCP